MLFVIVLHAVLVVLTYQLLHEKPKWFIGAEVLVVISAAISVWLYRSFIRPISLLQSGVHAIQDQDFSVKFVKTGSRELDGLVEVYNLMIDQLREERTQLQEQHFFLARIMEKSPLGMVLCDHDDRPAQVNPRASEIFQTNEADQIGRSDLWKKLMMLPQDQSEVVALDGIRRLKCHWSYIIDRGFRRKFVLMEDVTHEQLSAEREAYGRVIRMMAHEVNNSVGPVNSILQSILDFGTPYSEEEERDIRESVEIARQRNLQMNTFMRNLADVIRLPKPDLQPMDLNLLVTEVVSLMKNQLAVLDIVLRSELVGDNLPIMGDHNQLQQVLINIFTNAREAIGHRGTIVIKTRHPSTLEVIDDGPGISKEAEDQIFRPFFSTKPNGQGIGLTLIKEILTQHKAYFQLRNEDCGTVFRVVFPNRNQRNEGLARFNLPHWTPGTE